MKEERLGRRMDGRFEPYRITLTRQPGEISFAFFFPHNSVKMYAPFKKNQQNFEKFHVGVSCFY